MFEDNIKNYILNLYSQITFTNELVFCCSQNVERFVALTSKAAEYTIGYTNRHQWILNKVNATKKIPTSSKKEDYINLVTNDDRNKVKKKLCVEKKEDSV